MRAYADSPWADENNIAELRKLWPLPDWSARRIGEHLGVSRNAVISAARRLKLERFPNPVKYKVATSKRHRKKKPAPSIGSISNDLDDMLSSQPAPKPSGGNVVDLKGMWPRTGDSPKVTYARPKRHLDYSCDRPSDYQTCQWPEWDDVPDGRYCGAPTVKGRSFCQDHCEVAYRRPDGPSREHRAVFLTVFANRASKDVSGIQNLKDDALDAVASR